MKWYELYKQRRIERLEWLLSRLDIADRMVQLYGAGNLFPQIMVNEIKLECKQMGVIK